MKTLSTIFIIAVSLILINPAFASDKKHFRGKNKFFDYAKVVNVETIYRTVKVSQPRTECWDEHQRKPIKRRVRGQSTDGMVAGGIIGGVIGHQLGGGHGKDVATIAGTLIGAAIGHDQGSRTVETGEYFSEHRERCQTYTDYHTEQRPDGYRVTYRYRGEIFHARMDRRPGKRIRVKVRVTPVEWIAD